MFPQARGCGAGDRAQCPGFSEANPVSSSSSQKSFRFIEKSCRSRVPICPPPPAPPQATSSIVRDLHPSITFLTSDQTVLLYYS